MSFDIGKLKYWKGKHLSKKHRLKIKKSLALSKDKRSRIMKKAFLEGRLNPFWKGKKLPLSLRLRISETKKKQCQTLANRKKTSKFFKKYWKENPEKLLAVMNKTIYLWKKDKKLREEINKKISIAGKRRFSNPAEREKMRKSLKEMIRNHPNFAKEQSIRMKIYYAINPDARKRLLENNKNPFKADIRTKSGYFVRSLGEKQIADFLFYSAVGFKYETETIYLPESQYIPDFWLPSFNCFIEFFGQHPKANKTKLEKYKLYKKYKIPCVFITPSELENLRYFLLNELKKLRDEKACKMFNLERWQDPLIGLKYISQIRKIADKFPGLKDELQELEEYKNKKDTRGIQKDL